MPVPTSTMSNGAGRDADVPEQPSTAQEVGQAASEAMGGQAPPPPPGEAAQPPAGGTQALPGDALDFAAKMFDHAREGSMTLIDYIKAGLPPNLTNNRGDTLLMLAAYHGHAELVEAMLNIKSEEMRIQHDPVDPNQLNGRGQSIVAGAVFKGYDDVVRVLIEHGADPVAGQPNAEDTAKMFNKYDDAADGSRRGLKGLFENASGRGRGAREAPEAVPDREEQQRVPGSGPTNGSQAP